MTLDQIYADLTELVNSGDPTFANAANFVGQLAQQCQQGQMSKEELEETLLDVQRQINILQNMEQMAFKEKLNTCINGLIAIAGAV
jgi:polyhydroxyalkanoate synthesis regulator phasin